MPSFKSSRKIVLLPSDDRLSFTFQFTQNTSGVSNDGFLPYAVDATSVVATATSEDGTAVTSIFTTPAASVTSNIVTVTLKYPTEGAGRYFLQFVLGLSNGGVIEADFGRVFCEVS